MIDNDTLNCDSLIGEEIETVRLVVLKGHHKQMGGYNMVVNIACVCLEWDRKKHHFLIFFKALKFYWWLDKIWNTTINQGKTEAIQNKGVIKWKTIGINPNNHRSSAPTVPRRMIPQSTPQMRQTRIIMPAKSKNQPTKKDKHCN